MGLPYGGKKGIDIGYVQAGSRDSKPQFLGQSRPFTPLPICQQNVVESAVTRQYSGRGASDGAAPNYQDFASGHNSIHPNEYDL
jgi:hypothetical protein